MDRLTRLMLALMITLTASVGMAADGVTTVSLRATVRLAPGQAVTLGALAGIEGPEAGLLAPLPLATDAVSPGGWISLDADAVREAIDASDARSGSVVVLGSRVSLTRRAERPAPAPAADEPPPGALAPGVVTVRDHLRSWLLARFDARADALRADFDSRDGEILDTPTEGRVVEVGEIGLSGRTALRVTVYENDTILRSAAVRVGVEVRREALTVAVPLRRGARVAADQVERAVVWADPTDPPADPETAVGQALRRSVEPGELLRATHLEPPALIHRGQDVSVRTVRGSVVVTSTARARHDACDGELVELETKDRPSRRFLARVAGPGRAVMAPAQETTP